MSTSPRYSQRQLAAHARVVATAISRILYKRGGMGNGYETWVEGQLSAPDDRCQNNRIRIGLPGDQRPSEIRTIEREITEAVLPLRLPGVVVRISRESGEHGCDTSTVKAHLIGVERISDYLTR